MEDFKLVLSETYRFLQIRIYLWNYDFSLWEMLIFGCFAGIASFILFEYFFDK